MSFDLLETTKEVEAIAEEWDALLEQSDCYRPFLSVAWFLNACTFFGYQPKVFVAKENRRIRGVLPLALNLNEKDGGGIATLVYPHVHLADATDLIVSSEDTQTASDLLTFCLTVQTGKTRLLFRDIRKDSNVMKGAVLLQNTGTELNVDLNLRLPIPYVDVSQGWHPFLESKSRNFRSSVKRTFRALEEEKVRLDYVCDDSKDGERIAASFLSLHLQSFRKNSFFAVENTRNFASAVFPIVVKKGYFRVMLMKDDRDQVVGIFIEASGTAERTMAYQHGYDPAFQHLAPGRTMCLRAIQQACEEGKREYSLGRSSHPLKERLKTGSQGSYILTLSNFEESAPSTGP